MKLSAYLAENDLTDLAFAAKIGRNPTTIGRIRKGEVLPDWSTVILIHEATNGAVTANDYLPEHDSVSAPGGGAAEHRIAS